MGFFKTRDVTAQTVNEFINTYGAYVIEQAVLGGRHFTIETANVLHQGSQEEESKKAGVAGHASYYGAELKGHFEVQKGNKTRNEILDT